MSLTFHNGPLYLTNMNSLSQTSNLVLSTHPCIICWGTYYIRREETVLLNIKPSYPQSYRAWHILHLVEKPSSYITILLTEGSTDVLVGFWGSGCRAYGTETMIIRKVHVLVCTYYALRSEGKKNHTRWLIKRKWLQLILILRIVMSWFDDSDK